MNAFCNPDQDLNSLLRQLHQASESNSMTREKLAEMGVDTKQWLCQVSYLDEYFSHRKLSTVDQVKLKTEICQQIQGQWKQREEMEKVVDLENKRTQDQFLQKQQQAEVEAGDYLFMRSSWLHYKWNQYTEVDDRMDKLNKTIGMMKGHTLKKLSKERNTIQASTTGSDLLRQLEPQFRAKYERVQMEKQEISTRLYMSQLQVQKLQQANDKLCKESQKDKVRLRQLQVKVLDLSSIKTEPRRLEYSRVNSMTSSLARIQDDLQVYKNAEYCIQIKGENVENSEFKIHRTIDEIRLFLRPNSENESERGNKENLIKMCSSTMLAKSMGIRQSLLKKIATNCKYQRPKLTLSGPPVRKRQALIPSARLNQKTNDNTVE